MNLHGIVAPYIGTVNPFIPVSVRVSTGQDAIAANGERAPVYASPGAFLGTIAGTTLTIASIVSGEPQPGQTIVGTDIPADTLITKQLTGPTGGIGTYSLNRAITLEDETAIATTMVVRGQVQPVGWRDLQQLDALNISGSRVAIYLYGQFDGVVRPRVKRGDLVVIATGPSAGTYLVAMNLEQWPDWCKVACTLQNGS